MPLGAIRCSAGHAACKKGNHTACCEAGLLLRLLPLFLCRWRRGTREASAGRSRAQLTCSAQLCRGGGDSAARWGSTKRCVACCVDGAVAAGLCAVSGVRAALTVARQDPGIVQPGQEPLGSAGGSIIASIFACHIMSTHQRAFRLLLPLALGMLPCCLPGTTHDYTRDEPGDAHPEGSSWQQQPLLTARLGTRD